MSKVRFIADLHFGHNNMAVKRGFKSAKEHDNHIVDCWNNVVKKRDITYVLGDVTMEKQTNYHFLDKLLGSKIVVLGNHDMKNHVPGLLKHVTSVAGMIKYKSREFRKSMFLTHCPIHPSELDTRVALNIHGHIHEKTINICKVINPLGEKPYAETSIKDKRYICVSCEQVDYTPKLLSELIRS